LNLLGWRRIRPAIFTHGPISELPDGELLLYLRLAFGPASIAIGGVIVGGPLALAETSRLAPADFDRLFQSLHERGVAFADWRVRLAFLPLAYRDDPVASPNAAMKWARIWLALPACELRAHIRREIEADLARRDEAFMRSWLLGIGDEVLDDSNGYGNSSGNGSGNGCPNGSGNGWGITDTHSELRTPDPEKKPEPAKRAAKRRARESFAPDGAQAAASKAVETAADEEKLSAAAGLNGRVVQDAAPAPFRVTAANMQRDVSAAARRRAASGESQ
jgi:hypothetical protein